MAASIAGTLHASGTGGGASPVGFLHPGEMGSALAALVVRRGGRACWVPQGRSAQTRVRARDAGLVECPSLEALCRACPVVVGICPPHAALDLARAVAGTGFRGLYVDANAISPEHAREIAGMLGACGGEFVDAAVVGPPPAPGTGTRLYLSGAAAATAAAAACLAGEGLRIEHLGDEAGRASALKMCHSAMHKGQMALLFAALAAAERAGVRGELQGLFASRPATASYLDGLDEKVRRAAKAWRFAGEMDEVALTLAALGLPEGFHRAAGEIYRRLDRFEPARDGTALQELLDAIRTPGT